MRLARHNFVIANKYGMVDQVIKPDENASLTQSTRAASSYNRMSDGKADIARVSMHEVDEDDIARKSVVSENRTAYGILKGSLRI